MKKYQVGQQYFAIIDDELWTRVNPAILEAAPLESDLRKQRAPVLRRGVKKHKKHKGHTIKRTKIDPEVKRQIREEYKQGGKTINELSEKYGVSFGTAYSACKGGVPKVKGNSGEPLKLSIHPSRYVCPDGHRFESKLPLSHARCPECRQLGNVPDLEQPVTEAGGDL